MQRRILIPGAGKFLKLGNSSKRSWDRYTGVNNGSATIIESTVLSNGAFNAMKMVELSATHVAVIYQVTAATGAVKLVIADCSTNTPSFGSAVTVISGVTVSSFDISAISDSKLLVAFVDGTTGVVAHTYDVSGTTATIDADVTIESTGSSPTRCSVCALSTTRGLVAYAGGSADKVVGITMGGSPDIVEDGADATIAINTTAPSRMARISSTTALIVTISTSAISVGVVTDGGSPVTLGAAVDMGVSGGADYLYPFVSVISATRAVIGAGVQTTSHVRAGMFRTVTMSGDTISTVASESGQHFPWPTANTTYMETSGDRFYFISPLVTEAGLALASLSYEADDQTQIDCTYGLASYTPSAVYHLTSLCSARLSASKAVLGFAGASGYPRLLIVNR